jgi:hypothetical protein
MSQILKYFPNFTGMDLPELPKTSSSDDEINQDDNDEDGPLLPVVKEPPKRIFNTMKKPVDPEWFSVEKKDPPPEIPKGKFKTKRQERWITLLLTVIKDHPNREVYKERMKQITEQFEKENQDQ